MPKVIFTDERNNERVIDTQVGESLLEVAKTNGIDEIEGACGGAMACATCHVIVDPAWYGKLPAPLMDETDMLDLASGLTKTSRLGCQVRLTDALDGLKVRIPTSLKGLLGR